MDMTKMLTVVAVALVIIGALNWGLVGAFHYNLVSSIFGDGTLITRIIYTLVGFAGLFKLFLIAKK